MATVSFEPGPPRTSKHKHLMCPACGFHHVYLKHRPNRCEGCGEKLDGRDEPIAKKIETVWSCSNCGRINSRMLDEGANHYLTCECGHKTTIKVDKNAEKQTIGPNRKYYTKPIKQNMKSPKPTPSHRFTCMNCGRNERYKHDVRELSAVCRNCGSNDMRDEHGILLLDRQNHQRLEIKSGKVKFKKEAASAPSPKRKYARPIDRKTFQCRGCGHIVRYKKTVHELSDHCRQCGSGDVMDGQGTTVYRRKQASPKKKITANRILTCSNCNHKESYNVIRDDRPTNCPDCGAEYPDPYQYKKKWSGGPGLYKPEKNKVTITKAGKCKSIW